MGANRAGLEPESVAAANFFGVYGARCIRLGGGAGMTS